MLNCFIGTCWFVLISISCGHVVLKTTNLKNIFDSFTGSNSLELVVLEDVYLKDIINVSFAYSGSINVTGVNVSIKCKNEYSGFRFTGSAAGTNLMFQGITFSACGSCVPAVIVLDKMNAAFVECKFVDNTASGINARDSNVSITSSIFHDNRAHNVTEDFITPFQFG